MRTHRMKLDPSGTRWLVFDASGGFVRTMPVFAGGDGEGEGGTGGGEGSGGSGGTSGGDGGEGGSGAGAGGGDGGSGTGSGEGTPAPNAAEATLPAEVKTELETLRAERQKNADELKRARDEAAKLRVGAQDRAKAAARKALEDAGVEIPDDLKDDPKADENAAAAHKAKVEEQERELRARDIKDKLRDEADEQGANFKLLHGYLLSDNALSSLDPSADDFATKVKSLVQATLEKEPSLKKGQVPRKSGADLGGGPADDKPKSLQDAVSKHYAKA